MNLTIQDLENLQAILQENGHDYQLELEEGNIIVMGPSDIQSSEIGVLLIRLLANWVYPRKLGRVFDSSGGFILPNTDLRAPDVSFVSADRLRRSKRYFAELVPDLVVEIKSQSDRISKLKNKLKFFLEAGARVAILIDPDQETVTIYRHNDEGVVLSKDDNLTIPELFPGLEFSISEIWPPVFE